MANISAIKLPDNTTYNIKAGAIPYGEVDSTSTSTAYTATVPGINELKNGTIMLLRNGTVTSASGFKININGLGAKPVYNNLATGNTHTPTNPTRDTTIFNINYTMLFIYDEDLVSGGAWICYRGYDANTNTIGYQLRGNNGTRPTADKGYRYRLWLSSLDNQSWVPINTSTATDASTARSLNSRVIDPFGEIVYYAYNGTTNAAANLTATNIWQQYALTIGYSYVKSLTAWDPVYLKCEPKTTGGAVMKDIVQALPSTADGFIYIYLGIAYSATAMELRFYHPVYYHDGTGIRAWTGYTETDPIFTASPAHGITANDITNWNNKSDFSGSYNDLTDKPTIPVLPSNIVNTVTTTAGAHTTITNKTGNVSFSVPTKTSHLTNDSGFLTSSDIASVMNYKGTKASVADLPTSNNVIGDVWHITADGSEYAWDGTIWQELGTSIQIPANTGSNTTGLTISDHSATSIYGVSSSTTSVTGVQSDTTTASKVTVGSSTTDYGVKTTNTPTVIDTTKFNGGSYSHTGFSGGSFTRGNFSGGSLTMALDTTDTKKLKITFTAATHGNDSFTAASYGTDSFTAASLGSGFYTAGTAATLGSKVPTVSANDVTVPIKATSATTVPIKDTNSTTVVTSGTHSITDPGHTHTI
jgi:hypothetical protein